MKVDNELDYEYSGMKCSRVHCTWSALLGSDFCPECLERMGDTQEMSDKPDTVAISREQLQELQENVCSLPSCYCVNSFGNCQNCESLEIITKTIDAISKGADQSS